MASPTPVVSRAVEESSATAPGSSISSQASGNLSSKDKPNSGGKGKSGKKKASKPASVAVSNGPDIESMIDKRLEAK